MTKKNLGTKEEGWAGPEGESFGLYNGCENKCKFCYARVLKNRRKQKIWDDWDDPTPRKTKQSIKTIKNGRYMFPSTHDITPNNMVECLKIILKILEKGNDILIVSKPNYQVIKYLTSALIDYKNNIEFRFSISTINDNLLQYWEENAPLFKERLRCLRLAFKLVFNTSISIEPYLDDNLESIIRECYLFVTGDFWVGPMSHISDIKKHYPKIKELEWLYTEEQKKIIKTKLDKIDYANIRYKSTF